MDENFAIRLCLNHRDPVGFEFLVRKYRREAFFHAISILGNQEDALDACQESFTRAFAALPKLSYLDQFYPWFYRILRNCCLNMIGKRKTIRKYQQNCQTEHHSNKDTEIDPSIIVEKEEEKREVWETLNRLNPESREILIMKYIKGYNYNEIARLLSIPRGTVMSRLYYARKSFRGKHLENEEQRDQKG